MSLTLYLRLKKYECRNTFYNVTIFETWDIDEFRIFSKGGINLVAMATNGINCLSAIFEIHRMGMINQFGWFYKSMCHIVT